MKKFVNSLGKHEEFLAMVLLKKIEAKKNIEIYKVLFCLYKRSE